MMCQMCGQQPVENGCICSICEKGISTASANLYKGKIKPIEAKRLMLNR